MDILGAIAIGTEPFVKGQTSNSSINKRISRKETVIKPELLRNVIVQSIY